MSLSTARVTPFSTKPRLLSEGPRRHDERQELLWVDILGRQFHRARVGPP
jgi:sugar lactone lactonase YvrE